MTACRTSAYSCLGVDLIRSRSKSSNIGTLGARLVNTVNTSLCACAPNICIFPFTECNLFMVWRFIPILKPGVGNFKHEKRLKFNKYYRFLFFTQNLKNYLTFKIKGSPCVSAKNRLYTIRKTTNALRFLDITVITCTHP